MTVTIFKNFNERSDPHYVDVLNVLYRIKEGRSRVQIEKIRDAASVGSNYDKDKNKLPLVLFSAGKTEEKKVTKKDKVTGEDITYMSHRLDESIVEHSGLFALDFDKCDVNTKIEQLKKDPYLFAVWLGPSGKGVKGLVKCPASIEHHAEYYTAFLERYPDLDSTSRNISRGQFESYDPDLWLNEGSLVWDKRLTEPERKTKKEAVKNRRNSRIKRIAVDMIRSSYEGTMHETLLKAANLLGGYVASGRVDEEEAIKLLESEIKLKGPKDFPHAQQTIRDGIDNGKRKPLHETKRLEKSIDFTGADGSYSFLADDDEMMAYEVASVNGTLEMGLPTGINELNEYWMFKKHHLVWFAGLDNTGKSFLVWYLAVLAALLHNWKFLVYSAENGDGQLRKKLKEFYLGKSLREADDEELTKAHDFVKTHFKIMSSKELHTAEEMLMKAELVYDEGWEFDCFIAEPYNALDPVRELDSHRNNLFNLNRFRVFKENYSSLWICDHIHSLAARSRNSEGFVNTPHKAEVEGGQIKANKTDDFLILHRLVNHPERKNDTEINVQKIKDKETGGSLTEKDRPVILQMNLGYCGYSCNGVDPVKEFWKHSKIS